LTPIIGVDVNDLLNFHSKILIEKTNEDDETVPVMSQDFVCEDEKVTLTPNIIITYLKPGQSLEMEMTPRMGYARDHAKWSTVARVTFSTKPSGKHYFSLETTGQYSPEKLVEKALEIYLEK